MVAVQKPVVGITHDFKYSVVVPVFNEKGSIASLHKEILVVMRSLNDSFEILYVDDGSTDGTLDVLKTLNPSKVIVLNRNYGQATALDAGFKASKGEIVISLDGDGQNVPSDIPKLLDKLNSDNLDVVAGWRYKRKDSLGTRILTKTGRFFRRLFMRDGVHDSGCTLRVYRSLAVKSLDLQGEMHRYILGLLKWKGFLIGELKVSHRKRLNGKSKYGPSKAVRGFLDLLYVWFINKYSQRPLHAFGYASVLAFFLGLASLTQSVVARAVWGLSLNRNGFFFLGFFFIIISIMFFSFGILSDILIKVHLNTSPYESRYYVREVLGYD